ncbi:hypothetical protein PHYSODRAFT_321616 [Phytophthora sojae]|uniref:M96 mating-specific protein family n=1 Tax=Phytophthora sojae (strain P6497) TaxID=1094619 RepID=G4YPC1_PHYSP|nr:hypothetical protein PHYSODRAFT_321616 [Phytophthora sojae]EGZ27901.1 hypothetical protein PHYSODRAFT_321616 [Phytophthora sojae]|eukprot:XP_009515176.1 hypothetical protein PHYSODRAFT_321616 [Phytophthora sojae]
MAFLAEDEDAMRAFEAALSFVDGFSGDENTPEFTALNKTAEALSPVANGLELPSNAAADHESDAHSAGPVATVNSVVDATIQGPRYTSAVPNISRASGTAARPVSEVVKARHRAADNARKRMLRKAGKVGQLEMELRSLQERPGQTTSEVTEALDESEANGGGSSTCKSSKDAQVASIWEGFAARQKNRREKAEKENVRLKLVLEGQIKVAKSLENLLLKRAQQQIAECSSSIRRPGDILCPSGRTLDFRADAADFQELLEYLDVAYSEVDAVLAGNGLDTMKMTQQDLHMREGVNGMYLEVFSNKVMPFGLHATAEATWNYFKGSEKHRGNLYAKAAQELFAGNSSTDVRVKQIIRRYVEADRELVVWVATIAPIEIKRKAFAGLISHHRNYAVIKRAKASTPDQELSLLQLVAHVTLDTKEGTIYDPKYIRVLTDFLLSNAAGNIKADQELATVRRVCSCSGTVRVLLHGDLRSHLIVLLGEVAQQDAVYPPEHPLRRCYYESR